MIAKIGNECGFTGTDFADERENAFSPADARDEGVERRRVRRLPEEKSGIRRKAERLFSQAKIWLVRERASVVGPGVGQRSDRLVHRAYSSA